MPKAVEKIEFWKQRLDSYPHLRFSVYLTSQEDWDYIMETHTEIINKLIKDTDNVLWTLC